MAQSTRPFLLILSLAVSVLSLAAARSLDIYFIDVEGGQATLIVTPDGQSLLVDAGFAGAGFNDTTTSRGRDLGRILAAARDAGVTRIDFLLITHFHGDHDGGVPDLARQIPIRTFIDHGNVPQEAEETSRGTLQAFADYVAARARGKHIEPKPGDRLSLKGVDVRIVSSAGSTLSRPLAGAGAPTAACDASPQRPPQEPHENPRSTGFRLQFGEFKFLDVGDLTGPPLYSLVCPTDLVGPVDVYLVSHHGGTDAADPVTVGGFEPRVAILNNGSTKGGAPDMFTTLRAVTGVVDVWQLHRSLNPGAQNFADDRIANLDETTAHWIKLTAERDGSFSITNGRTGSVMRYPPRGGRE